MRFREENLPLTTVVTTICIYYAIMWLNVSPVVAMSPEMAMCFEFLASVLEVVRTYVSHSRFSPRPDKTPRLLYTS